MGVRHAVNESFFDTWSDEMAYVLGYMYADGNIVSFPSIRAKYVRFFSTDKDRIELIRLLMNSEHRIHIEQRIASRKPLYRIHIGSHRLFDALARHGVTPRKSLTCTFPDVPNAYLAAFVLGYFDGDGCAFLERSKAGNPKKLLSVFTSGSREFLGTLHERLEIAAGITGTRLYQHGSSANAFQLRYATRNSMRLFQLIYGSDTLRKLALSRKYAIFMKYFEERGIGPGDFPSVLTKKGPVVK